MSVSSHDEQAGFLACDEAQDRLTRTCIVDTLSVRRNRQTMTGEVGGDVVQALGVRLLADRNDENLARPFEERQAVHHGAARF